MPNFNDLPKPVREQIYQLHLVHQGPIGIMDHFETIHHKYDTRKHFCPPLLKVSKKIDKEAAHFYYAKNEFDMGIVGNTYGFCSATYPRHLRLVQRLIVTWGSTCLSPAEGFRSMARMKVLQQLCIRVDERDLAMRTGYARNEHQRIDFRTLTPQQQLSVRRYTGMTGLLSLSGISVVKFIPEEDDPETGAIPGGVLETEVAPRVRAAKAPCRTSRYVALLTAATLHLERPSA